MENSTRKNVTFEDVERRLVESHLKPYYDWLRHVVTLALAALTTLVALQGHYVPKSPVAPYLLALGWVALAVSIVFGPFALRSEYAMPLSAVEPIKRMRRTQGDVAAAISLNSNSGTLPHPLHKWAVRGMVFCFLIALFSICTFAVVNLPW